MDVPYEVERRNMYVCSPLLLLRNRAVTYRESIDVFIDYYRMLCLRMAAQVSSVREERVMAKL